ncbi:TPA: hypothetical protein ACJPC2_000638 [Streptococcus pyogenes]
MKTLLNQGFYFLRQDKKREKKRKKEKKREKKRKKEIKSVKFPEDVFYSLIIRYEKYYGQNW